MKSTAIFLILITLLFQVNYATPLPNLNKHSTKHLYKRTDFETRQQVLDLQYTPKPHHPQRSDDSNINEITDISDANEFPLLRSIATKQTNPHIPQNVLDIPTTPPIIESPVRRSSPLRSSSRITKDSISRIPPFIPKRIQNTPISNPSQQQEQQQDYKQDKLFLEYKPYILQKFTILQHATDLFINSNLHTNKELNEALGSVWDTYLKWYRLYTEFENGDKCVETRYVIRELMDGSHAFYKEMNKFDAKQKLMGLVE